MENKYPEYIMRQLRQRRELEPDDISEDTHINSYSSDTAFSEVVQWNGFLGGWDSSIKGWIKGIYGIDLDETTEQKKIVCCKDCARRLNEKGKVRCDIHKMFGSDDFYCKHGVEVY